MKQDIEKAPAADAAQIGAAQIGAAQIDAAQIDTAQIDVALSEKNWPRALERMFAAARTTVKAEANRAGVFLEDLDVYCRQLAQQLAADLPVTAERIGFDRPTNIYVVSEIYQAGGHRSLIDQIIAALPEERHIVLFTGAHENTRAYGLQTITASGGFPIYPDASLDLFDRLLWLREKLASFTARRLFVFHHPNDVLAAVALAECAGRYGRRTYVVHHADTVASLGVDLDGATHLAIRPEQKRRISDLRPGYPVHLLPLTYDPERLDPPIEPDIAERIAEGEHDFLSTGSLITATCGGGHKFLEDGPLGLPGMIVRILKATRGRHFHIGPLTAGFKSKIQAALSAARIAPDRLTFLNEVRSVAETLVTHKVDLFLTSFPVGGGLTVVEVAYAGVPVAVYGGASDDVGRYISGLTHAPEEALVWNSPEELEEALRAFWLEDGKERLEALAEASRRWFSTRTSGVKFRRRLLAVVEVCERRRRAPLDAERKPVAEALIDSAYYLRQYPDVVVAEMDPAGHFLIHGEQEKRRPNPLFDPGFYLSQLTSLERKMATPAPLTHYVMRGEALGYRPHRMFDPGFCRASLEAAGLWEPDTGDAGADSVLARYLRAGDRVAPHMFFDPAHYARQARLVPDGQPLLVHFIETGANDGLSPHPLIRPERIGRAGKTPLEAVLAYLTQSEPREGDPRSTVLFDPEDVGDEVLRHYSKAAPNLLWAHLIEGNQGDRDPHTLISVRHVERMRPGTLVSADAIIRHLATNRLGVDSHPLVQGAHILKQAPHASTLPISLTQYFLENGVDHNIDPHPLFSTQYYLYNNPDLQKLKSSPLVHYLRHGQYEGRAAHPAFDGNTYYQSWLKQHGGGSPLLDYVSRGMARFLPTLPMDEGLRRLTRKTAVGLFEIGGERDPDGLLAGAIHPDAAPRHPTLRTETRPYSVDAGDAAETVEIYPEETVFLDRPSVVAQTHIAPPIGDYLAPAATASIYLDATVVPGNDGFAAATGRWIDHGLFGFDKKIMRVKHSGAVVAVADGHVLLRRYRSEISLPAGIFASGTYSHNYFHFLLEVLPRVLLAAGIAPAGTPVLADDGMPDQHYQALRLFLPDRPVLRLSRHASLKVGKLYVGSMPNLIQDAFGLDMPPADAIRYHPAMIRRLASLGGALPGAAAQRRLYLHREGPIRKLLNSEEIRAALIERDFDVAQCASMSFSEQISLFSEAGGGIVGQSGAHLANMLFAPRGTRVFALFSNAPGTNFYLWSALGALLGHEVVNIAGWRIAGSAPGDAPEAHEDFTVPAILLTPFFPKTAARRQLAGRDAEARALLDDLFEANAEAEALTGAWSVRSRETPEGFDTRLIETRRLLRSLLKTLPEAQIADLLDHPFYAEFGNNIWSGFVALRDHDAKEQETIADIESYFESLSRAAPGSPAGADPDSETEAIDQAAIKAELKKFERMLALAMIYTPAWKLPLVADLGWIDPSLRKLYLAWLATPPFLFRDGDDAGYVGFIGRLLDWLAGHLDPAEPAGIRTLIAETAARMEFGQLLLVGEPLRPVLAARNRLLDQIAVRDGPPARALPRPGDLSQGRIRIGILCRTFVKGPDSEAVVAFFKSFDRTRFEIFAYSVAYQDRVVAADEGFDRVFDAAIDHRRVVSSDPHDMRERLLADDLDVFLYANATTFGVREQELALFHRVAPLQMVLNSHLPMSPGFPSFDFFLTGRSDDPAAEVSDADYPERLLRVEGPVINYLNSLKPKPKPSFDRATLGLSEDDVVMMNGGSSQKLRNECLTTMLRALAAVPNGKLLLAPYNPGWAGRSQAFAFNRQLAEAAGAVGVSMDRIIVLGELSVAEAEAALSLSDIYLSSFPHGGATMTHLALIYGTPPVVLRRRGTRSIDQFLVGSLGFGEMLASTPDDYVDLVARLAADKPGLGKLSEEIRTAARHPVFVANPDFSRAMQAAITGALDTVAQGAGGSGEDEA